MLDPLFAGCFGAFLGLALLKFGNPPIMEKFVSAPTDIYEFLLGSPWPIAWAYGLLVVVTLLALLKARWRRPKPLGLVILPLAWLGWQVVAASQASGPEFAELTHPTVVHFFAVVICFYLGYFALSRVKSPGFFWFPLICAFLLVLAFGWEQHFGGLAKTREYYLTQIYPHELNVPLEKFRKMASTRIFSTLFYPNTLAGALLLLLPVVLTVIFAARRWLTRPARIFSVLCIGMGALGSLYWSGSKSGWLLMLVLGLLTVLRLPISKKIQVGLLTTALVGGLAGFAWRYHQYLERGATSVSARADYWRAALSTAMDHPFFGTGPGTFQIPYKHIKRPESEMARLVHNDYFEQASDSGLPGFVFFTAFILATLVRTAPPVFGPQDSSPGAAPEPVLPAAPARVPGELNRRSWTWFAVWLGLLGWALQQTFEFGLYIPALAWTAFALMGLLLAKAAEPATSSRQSQDSARSNAGSAVLARPAKRG